MVFFKLEAGKWRQVVVLAAFGVFLVPGAYAANGQPEQTAETQTRIGGVEFSGRLSAGYLTGEAREYVYASKGSSIAGHKNSELIWEIDDMLMLGAGLTIRPRDGLTINADYWFNIEDGDGTLDDYDWLWLRPEWTDWSHHENTDVTEGRIFDLNVDMRFYSTDSLAMSGIVGYKQDLFEWKAYDGTFVYSNNGFRNRRGSFEGLGITYEQTFDVPYVGLGLSGGKDRLGFQGRLIYSPFVSGEAVDHHHLRSIVGKGSYSDGEMFGLDLTASYAFTDSLKLSAGYKYQEYEAEKFDLKWTEKGLTRNLRDGFGMENEYSMFSLGLGYAF